MLSFAGWIEIETKSLEFMESDALPETDSKVAEIFTIGFALVGVVVCFAATRPVAVTEATRGSEDAQVATSVMSWVLPSVNVAVAVNC